MENDQNGFDAAKIKLLALHIMGKCGKFHDPSYLGTPLKSMTHRGTEGQRE